MGEVPCGVVGSGYCAIICLTGRLTGIFEQPAVQYVHRSSFQ